MAKFKVETKNAMGIERKPRVYFTCHPADLEKYFPKICEDIFCTHDCAIYYTGDMAADISGEEQEVELSRCNLFVVPVTLKLLTTPNRAMDADIPFALSSHIPVLPILMERGLDAIYSRPDRFGELQYLNPFSRDTTEISYEDKLKKYLDSVLISDQLAERIRAAFDAYIFLSYRKKDRRYANELMRLIHSNPECRDIAIWFDEFLTPGESFKANIEKILDECKLFTLLITPQLLEKVIDGSGVERDNYVLSTELPLARKKREEKGTGIFAVEMEDTDREALRGIHIEDYVRGSDAAFRTRLLEAVAGIATTANDTPEHNFLVGLAYLEGIDVEVDRDRALELITSAAEDGLPEAMEKLRHMYEEGIGVALDYRKAVVWAEKYAGYMVAHYGEEHPDTLTALNNLAGDHAEKGDHRKALELQERVYELRCRVLGEEHPDTLRALNNLAYTYGELGEPQKTLEMQKKICALRRKVLGEEHPDTLNSLGNLAYAYGMLGDYERALELQEGIYSGCCKLLGKEHPDTLQALCNLAYIYGRRGDLERERELEEKVLAVRSRVLGEEHPDTLTVLGNLAATCEKLGDHGKALELGGRTCSLQNKVLGVEHPDTLRSIANFAIIYGDWVNREEALELEKRVYRLRCKVLGEEHPDTLTSLSNLAYTHEEMDDFPRALELGETVYLLRCKVLGETHEATLFSLSKLAFRHMVLGHDEIALTLYEKLYAQRMAVNGKNHQLTKHVLWRLNELRAKLSETD